jgi:uncharacterized membrane protein YuzA (DUF378 family)
MKTFEKVTLVFTIIGAINWGLVGAFDMNIVTMLLKNVVLQDIVYMVIGVCGLVNIGILFMDLNEKRSDD